uniref:ATP-dependent metallopeptidase HflB subfamily protein n=1 Tax=Toxoplasma gondii COUG TaxID=1074873 RepID=A0A2G8XYB2_TOXGO|nr:ATP-dependent metallopeptidase HflB subfamily protein [Toxoplasma gondii COUG]
MEFLTDEVWSRIWRVRRFSHFLPLSRSRLSVCHLSACHHRVCQRLCLFSPAPRPRLRADLQLDLRCMQVHRCLVPSPCFPRFLPRRSKAWTELPPSRCRWRCRVALPLFSLPSTIRPPLSAEDAPDTVHCPPSSLRTGLSTLSGRAAFLASFSCSAAISTSRLRRMQRVFRHMQRRCRVRRSWALSTP